MVERLTDKRTVVGVPFYDGEGIDVLDACLRNIGDNWQIVLVKSLFLLDNSAKTVKIIFMTKLIFKKTGLFPVLSVVVSLLNGATRNLPM